MNELAPYIKDINTRYRQALEAVKSQDEIAARHRRDSLWWGHLNLSTTECALLRGEEVPLDKPVPPRTFELAWTNYIRKALVPGAFRSFPSRHPGQSLLNGM